MLDARLQLTIHLHSSAVIDPAACLMSVCAWISPLPGASSEISKPQIALPVCYELVLFAAVPLQLGGMQESVREGLRHFAGLFSTARRNLQQRRGLRGPQRH